jgi:hypothetical protein
VKGTYLEEVEVLEQEEEEEVEEAMKESQVMKALHKDVIFARTVVMLRKTVISVECYTFKPLNLHMLCS